MLTQDCSDLLVTVGECKRIPKGINIIGADGWSASGVEGMSCRNRVVQAKEPRIPTASKTTSWSYLSLPHMAAKNLERWLVGYNADRSHQPQPFFVHRSVRYGYRNADGTGGVRKEKYVSVSGLVFLQGAVERLKAFLAAHCPQCHLVNNCATGTTASIEDCVMRPFMHAVENNPGSVTFLDRDFESFARDHVRLRVLTGLFRGYEGYIVRVDRDRQLVFDFGGRTVAIRGIHKEVFEVAEAFE